MKLPDARRRARGEPGGTQAATWRGPPPGRARRAPGLPGPPLVPPFGLYYLLAPETLRLYHVYILLEVSIQEGDGTEVVLLVGYPKWKVRM